MMEREPIEERAQDFYDSMFDKDMCHLLDVAEGTKKPNQKERDEYGEEMSRYPASTAQQALQDMHFGIKKEVIYNITLAGGGPAARIRVEVDDGAVVAATFQFQEWFEKWTDAPQQNNDLVERFARIVGYYEEG